MKELEKKLQAQMDKTIEALKYEFSTIRAGRANAQMLDKIRVDYYGTPTPINQIGSISVPEPRTLVINPWDKSAMKEIEKAIMNSDLGLNPTNDGDERRVELTKKAKKAAEEFKVRIRNERRDANDKLKKMQKDGEVTEDELKRGQEDVQKLTDKYIKEIDSLLAVKEKDIMAV